MKTRNWGITQDDTYQDTKDISSERKKRRSKSPSISHLNDFLQKQISDRSPRFCSGGGDEPVYENDVFVRLGNSKEKR